VADNIMGSLADQSTYDPATGMPYPGNAPDYGDLSQRAGGMAQVLAPSSNTVARIGNATRRMTSGEFLADKARELYDFGAMPGRAFGTVPGGPPTPEEEANWGAGTALGMLGAARLPGGAPAGAVGAGGAKLVQPDQGIFAYHSSPYTFDKFDLSKIGTGEGAQAYGHGIYAAENPAVSGQGGQYWNQFFGRFSGPEFTAADYLKMNKFDRQQAIEHANTELNTAIKTGSAGPTWMNNQAKALQLLESGNPVGPRTYEVNINARPEQMLDWDKPLVQQSPYAQSVLEQLGSAQKNRPLLPTDTGRDVYYKQTQGIYNKSASPRLNEAGISGIRYLDQGSRPMRGLAQTQDSIAYYKDMLSRHPDDPMLQQQLAAYQADLAKAQQGTSNYVIFDPSKIDIRKMYAVPGAVGAGAAGMGALAAQDNYQPAGQ
jgi:hypothetical protein